VAILYEALTKPCCSPVTSSSRTGRDALDDTCRPAPGAVSALSGIGMTYNVDHSGFLVALSDDDVERPEEFPR
jgi:hypothetical protein